MLKYGLPAGFKICKQRYCYSQCCFHNRARSRIATLRSILCYVFSCNATFTHQFTIPRFHTRYNKFAILIDRPLPLPPTPPLDPRQGSDIPLQLLRLRPGTRPRTLQARTGLVLDIRAQHLGGSTVLGLDVDAREMEPVARRRRAAVDRRRHIVPACARDVFPADVADGQAGGVAVLVGVWPATGLVRYKKVVRH